MRLHPKTSDSLQLRLRLRNPDDKHKTRFSVFGIEADQTHASMMIAEMNRCFWIAEIIDYSFWLPHKSMNFSGSLPSKSPWKFAGLFELKSLVFSLEQRPQI